MKVLQINCVYKKGSTGKITSDLHRGLLDTGIESIVCYGRGTFVKEPGVYKTCSEWYSKLNNALSRVTGIMYGGCFFSTKRLISIIKKEKPDIVHLQCINGYFVNIYRLITWLKENHIKTVLTLHAEFMYTGGCGISIDCNQWNTNEGCGHPVCPRYYQETKSLFFDRTGTMWRRMKDTFEGFENDLYVVSVSPWLMKRARQSVILGNMRHCVIYNGLNINVFHPYSTEDLRKKHCCQGKKVVFHATPTFSSNPKHLKGGYYVIELAKRMPTVQFLVAGNCVGSFEVPQNVTLLGQVLDQELLARYYSMADVTVLTSKRETFSMVCAESLCCGTPVVGFKAGGPEEISIHEYSSFCDYGFIDGLMNLLQTALEKRYDKQYLAEMAVKRYSTEMIVEKYLELYQEVIKV